MPGYSPRRRLFASRKRPKHTPDNHVLKNSKKVQEHETDDIFESGNEEQDNGNARKMRKTAQGRNTILHQPASAVSGDFYTETPSTFQPYLSMQSLNGRRRLIQQYSYQEPQPRQPQLKPPKGQRDLGHGKVTPAPVASYFTEQLFSNRALRQPFPQLRCTLDSPRTSELEDASCANMNSPLSYQSHPYIGLGIRQMPTQGFNQPTHANSLPTPRHSSNSPCHSPLQINASAVQPAQMQDGRDLVSVASLDSRFRSIFPYTCFNAVQSRCFPAVYSSDHNVVVSAPTGSGKTAIFELAICRLVASQKREFKIVYQAPTKALCAERAQDWQKKFKCLNLQVAEFTGDSSAFENRRIRTASIIITTPEKWDSMTRKWSGHGRILQKVRLVLIDEIHTLKDMRGATLEAVISRMKTLGEEIRFVGLSATIPNVGDIACWLGLNSTYQNTPARTFVCGEEFRPVQLQKLVFGFNHNGNEHAFDSVLDGQLPNLLVRHSQGKPVLVFCFTRKSCESAALALSEYWDTHPPHKKPWPGSSVALRSSDDLRELMKRGVAFHHGGVNRCDRSTIEEAFKKGYLNIVCCTSTLAVGVNLPCHTVILKGTLGYKGGKLTEYDELEVMQMIGRAGRPQFDTSASAIILTRNETKDKYANIGGGNTPIESTLHLNLIEHLNSEAVLGTISSLESAARWLKGTFLTVRLRHNRMHYNLANTESSSTTTDEMLYDICKKGIQKLAELGLIRHLEDWPEVFRSTEYGRAMSTYMVRIETMELMLGMPKTVSIKELINTMTRASEFDELRIKNTERPTLRELNNNETIPFKFEDGITETWQKISVLLQVEISRGNVSYQQRLAVETRQAADCMMRLLEAYIICAVSDKNGSGVKAALELARCLAARAWEGHPSQLCQVPNIGPVSMKKLVDNGITTILQLAELGHLEVGRFLSKNPPAAMKISESARSLPRLNLAVQVEYEPLRTVKRSETGRKAVVKVTLGHANTATPRWVNKVPLATFLAVTSDGSLEFIWRGRVAEKNQEICFSTTPGTTGEITCYLTCDDTVGTLLSKKVTFPRPEVLKADLTREATETAATKKSPGDGAHSHDLLLGELLPEELEPCSPYKNTAEEDPVAIIDLSTEKTDENLDRDRFKIFTKLQGDGTAQTPWELDDTDSTGDIDGDIFDDVDFPMLMETALDMTAMKPTISDATIFKGDVQTTTTDPKKKNGLLSQKDSGEENETGVVKTIGPFLSHKQVQMGWHTKMPSHSLAKEASLEVSTVPKLSFNTKPEDSSAKIPHGMPPYYQTNIFEGNTTKEKDEPNWVDVSDQSIIGFLRGHVTFV